MTGPDLVAMQQWMQRIVTGSNTEDRSNPDLRRIVKGDPRITAEERLAVYASGYHARLMNCMKADYPILRKTLGDDLFHQFAAEYLRHCPPRTYTLFQLGAGFPQHLEQTRPDGAAPPEERNAMYQLPIDLASLERAWVEVLRGPGLEKQLERCPVPIGPVDHLFLKPAPGLKLLRLDFPLAHYYQTLRDGGNASIPDADESFLAVSRVQYRVILHPLEPWQYQFLGNLPGLCKDTASKTAEICGLEPSFLQARLSFWLSDAVARCLLTAQVERSKVDGLRSLMKR